MIPPQETLFDDIETALASIRVVGSPFRFLFCQFESITTVQSYDSP
jgi:hypothetical protein